MSALPPKADILRVVVECLLMTQSGHSQSWYYCHGGELSSGGTTVQIGINLPGALDAITDRQERAMKDITPKPTVIEHNGKSK